MEKRLEQVLKQFAAMLTDSFRNSIETITAFGPLLQTDRPRDGVVDVMIVFSHPVSGTERIQVIKLAGAVSKMSVLKEGARRISLATDCVSKSEYDTYINSCSPHWKKAREGTILFSGKTEISSSHKYKNMKECSVIQEVTLV